MRINLRNLFGLLAVFFLVLAMATSAGASCTVTIEVRVSANWDDVEEYQDGDAETEWFWKSTDLELVYDGSSRGNQIVGIRFLNVTVPQGSTIDSAYIEFEVDETNNQDGTVRIQGEKATNAAAFQPIDDDVSDRDVTTAHTDWVFDSSNEWNTVNEKKQTPGLISIVQEIADQGGWSSGNAMVFIFTTVAGSPQRKAESYNGEPQNAPLLHIEFTPPPGTTVTEEVRVSAGDDDAEEEEDGSSIDFGSSDLELAYDSYQSRGNQTIGIRFLNVRVPKGASIENAYIEFEVDNTNKNASGTLSITGQAHDDAPAFESPPTNNISVRDRTSAVSWTPLDADWDEIDENPHTPDIKSVIQEIVNRGGWSCGNAMVFIITGTGTREAESFNGESSAAPLLHIEYKTGDYPTISLDPATLTPTAVEGTDADPQSFTIENTGTDTLNYHLSIMETWLSCDDQNGDPESGTLAAGESIAVTVSYDTDSLTAGTHTNTIMVEDPNATNSPQNLGVTLTVTGKPEITLSTASLTHTIDEGDSQASDTFTLENTGNAELVYNISDNATWLSCDPDSGTLAAGASATITVNYTGEEDLAASPPTHTATISVSDNSGVADSKEITVELTVNAVAIASVNPTTLSQTVDLGNNADSQSYTITNTGSAELTYSISDNATWLSTVDPAGGSLAAGASATITVNYTTGGLTPPGTYTATITISGNASNGDQTVSVSMRVYGIPVIALDPTELTPATNQGSDAAPASFTLGNTGNDTLNYTITDNADAGGVDWLSCSPTSGQVSKDPPYPGITVVYDTDELACGTYTATITVASSAEPHALTSATVSVTLTVTGVEEESDGVNNQDDAEENGTSGAMSLTSSDLELVQESTQQTVGIRFKDIDISRTARITSAYIKFTVDETDSGTTNLTIYGEDIDDAPIFTSGAYNISSRTKTCASVDWSNIETWNPVGAEKQTPDLKTIVQEIVTRENWTSGNDMAFIITGSGKRVADSYATSTGPFLHVEYVCGDFPIIDITPKCPTFTPSSDDGSPAASDTFTLKNTGLGTLNYSFSYGGATWLSCSPASGSLAAGASTTITVNYITKPVGTYNATITVSDSNATNSPQTIGVTLTVTGRPAITLNLTPPTPFTYDIYSGGSISDDTFTVENSGTGPDLNYSITEFPSDYSWLSCTSSGGALVNGATSPVINIEYTTGSLGVGTHTATIRVADSSASNSPQDITVTVNVTAAPFISVDPTTLNQTVDSGITAYSQTFSLENTGTASLTYSISDTENEGGDWLTTSSTGGSLAVGAGSVDITVSYASSTLDPGIYTATITVSDNSGVATSKEISVTLRVYGRPIITVSPTELSTLVDQGSDAEADSYTIGNTGNDTLNYIIAANANWLTCTNAGGTSSGQVNAGAVTDPITVTYDTDALNPGIYAATITVSSSAEPHALTPATISVTLTVKGIEEECSGASTDDAEELLTEANSMYLTSTDLELVDDGSTEQIVGIRFANIDVPRAAVITAAYMEFTVDETNSGATSVTIYGEVVGDAPTFTTTAGNISGRTKTGASVDWTNIPAWSSAGEKKQTPELKTIVQEIVNQAGWNSGQAMAFIITGSGERTAEAYDTGQCNIGPKIHIEYILGDFPIIDVDKTSLTPSADQGNDAASDTFTLRNAGSSALSYSITDDVSWLSLSTTSGSLASGESIPLTVTYDTDQLTGGTYNATITITGQDALNSPTTIAVTLAIRGPEPYLEVSRTYIGITSYETNWATRETFTIRNTGTSVLNVTSISDNADAGGTDWVDVSPTSGTLDPGQTGTVAIDFNNSTMTTGTYEAAITIACNAPNCPREVQISLTIMSVPVSSTCGEVPVYTENLVSPAVLLLLDVSGSMRSMMNVWATEQTDNISSIVQEIVNRAGWQPGNAMAFFFDGSGRRTAYSFDDVTGTPPMLHVAYGGTEVNIPVKYSRDDAEERANDGIVDFDNQTLELVVAPTYGNQTVGLRFRDIPIPQGATITNAYIEFTPIETSNGSAHITVVGQDHDNAPEFDDTNAFLSDIVTNEATTAEIDYWDVPDWAPTTQEQRVAIGRDVIYDLVGDRAIAWGYGTWCFSTSNGYLGDSGPPYPSDSKHYTRIHVGCKLNDDTHLANLRTAINATTSYSGTPFGPSLLAADQYYLGNRVDETYSETYTTLACQPKVLIDITDGLGYPSHTTNDLIDTYTRLLASENHDVSSVAVGFGIDSATQIQVMASVANDLGEASDDDKIYALHEEDVNGVGQPFIAQNKVQLVNALQKIVSNIKSQVFQGSAPAASSTSVESADMVITARFDPTNNWDPPYYWNGDLVATELINGVLGNQLWSAKAVMPNTKNAFTVVTTNGTSALVEYTTDTLTGDNYLCKKLGDIINSTPVIVGGPSSFHSFDSYSTFKTNNKNRTKMVYVGANDGALHAFGQSDGVEVWRFYPESIHSTLTMAASDSAWDMCDEGYCHRYYVDGSPKVGDIYDGTNWKTILVCGLREGGEAYFALDVTTGQMNDTGSSEFLWEFTDTELGQTWTDPAIERVATNTWAVFFGSGYASSDTNQATKEAYLYGIKANDKSALWNGPTNKIKISSTTLENDALSPVLVVDVDDDQKGDHIYAGNLYGTMTRVSNIGYTATPNVTKLFDFGNTTHVNPIRGKAAFAYGSGDFIWVYFGTGRYEDHVDKTSMTQQYFFGLQDTLNATSTYALGDLTSLSAEYLTDDVTGKQYRTVTGTNDGKNSWVIALDNTSAGLMGSERVISAPIVVAGVLLFTTFIPDEDICAGNGKAWLYAVDYETGLPPSEPIFDVNEDNDYDDQDKIAQVQTQGGQEVTTRVPVAAIPLGDATTGSGQPADLVLHKDVLLPSTPSGGTLPKTVNLEQLKAALQSWRERNLSD